MTYLPYVANNVKNKKLFEIRARELFELIRVHPNQKRKKFIWDSKLAEVAYQHCRDMAINRFFGHVNLLEIGANQRIRNTGYRLPDNYSPGKGNNVESLAAGDPTTLGTLNAWLNSSGHRPHVFGENEFYAVQSQVAVGYFEGGYYKRYWCFLACHEQA